MSLYSVYMCLLYQKILTYCNYYLTIIQYILVLIGDVIYNIELVRSSVQALPQQPQHVSYKQNINTRWESTEQSNPSLSYQTSLVTEHTCTNAKIYYYIYPHMLAWSIYAEKLHIKSTTRVLSHFAETIMINTLLQLLCTRIRTLQFDVMHPGVCNYY